MHACLSWMMTGPPMWSSSRRHCLHASTGRVYINITYDNGHGFFWNSSLFTGPRVVLLGCVIIH